VKLRIIKTIGYINIAICLLVATVNAEQITLSAQVQKINVDAEKTKDHYALLIANTDYDDTKLANLPSAKQDVDHLKNVLIQRMGFQADNVTVVQQGQNETAKSIKKAVIKFTRELSEGSTVVIYYAGHGFTLTNRPGNFIVPTTFSTIVDAVNAEEAVELIEDDLISIEEIIEIIRKTKPEGVVLFYNACRSNAFDAVGLSTTIIFQGTDDDGGYKPGPIKGSHAFFAAGYGQQAIARIDDRDNAENKLTLYGRVLTDVLSKIPSMDFDILDKKLYIEVQQILEGSGLPKSKWPVPTYFKMRVAGSAIDETGTCLARGTNEGRSVCTDIKGNPYGQPIIQYVDKIVIKEQEVLIESKADPVAVECDTLGMHPSAYTDNPNRVDPIYQADTDPDAISKACLSVLKTNPGHKRARLFTALALVLKDSYAEAIEDLLLLVKAEYLPAIAYLANIYTFNSWKNDDEAINLGTKACQNRIGFGCAVVGSVYSSKGKVSDDKKILQQAIQYYEQGCELGYSQACNAGGVLYIDHFSDGKSATVLYEKGCVIADGRDAAHNCSNLAWAYEFGKNGKSKNLARAVDLYSKACGLDLAIGCRDAGAILRKANEITDQPRALSLLRKGCALTKSDGSAGSCTTIGYMYERGEADLAVNIEKALHYYEQACEGDRSIGCRNAGLMYQFKQEPPKYDKAKVKYQKACNLENGNACYNLGNLYRDGNIGAVDFIKASEYYKKGCELKYGDACGNLAELYEDGDLGGVDFAKAEEYFSKGCKLDSGWSCGRLADIYEDGDLGAADFAKAEEYFNKGCELDNGWSCGRLADIYEDGI
jgi:TPR repeat protein